MSPVDYDALKGRLKGGSTRGWKPNPGENPIRVLYPSKEYVSEEDGGGGRVLDRIALEFRSHFLRLEGGDLQVFRCPRDHDKTCPACEFFFAYRKSEDEAVKQMAERFSNSQRYALNIVDLSSGEAVSKGIQAYEVGPMIRNQILEFASKERWGEVLSPGADGRNFYLTFTPASESRTNRNNYKTDIDPEAKSILELLPDEWVEHLDDLDRVVSEDRSDEEIRKLVDEAKLQLGMEVEETPKPKKTPAKKSKKTESAPAEPPPAEEVGADEDDEEKDEPVEEKEDDEVKDLDAKLAELGL